MTHLLIRKKHKPLLCRINSIITVIFCINTVFLPYDNFGLKKLMLLMLLVINCGSFFKKNTKDEIMVLLFGTIVMITAVITSAILTGDFIGNLRWGYTFVMVLLYIIFKKRNVDFVKIFMQTVRALAFFVIIVFVLHITGIVPLMENPVLAWLHKYPNENLNYGVGENLITGIAIFMKTSPMMLLGMAYSFEKGKKISAFACLGALILSGTRANIITGIALFGIGVIITEKKLSRRGVILLILGVLSAYLFFALNIPELLTTINYMKAAGDDVRFGTLESILRLWKKDPVKFIIGMGYTSTFYVYEKGRFVSDVELSYWNLLRQVGLIQFSIIMCFYMWPIIMLIKNNKNKLMLISYILYLAVAYTNPFLITSTGLIVLLFMYCYAGIDHEVQCKNSRCVLSLGRFRLHIKPTLHKESM